METCRTLQAIFFTHLWFVRDSNQSRTVALTSNFPLFSQKTEVTRKKSLHYALLIAGPLSLILHIHIEHSTSSNASM